MPSIKDSVSGFIKQVDPKKWALFTVAWVALITFVFYIFRANDNNVVSEINGNVAIYPSVFESMVLFLKHGWNILWVIPSLICSASVGLFVAAIVDDLIEWQNPWQIIGAGLLPMVFSILFIYVGGSNVGEFTHHTVTPQEYEKVKDKHVDYMFYEANQPDSLFFHSFGKDAK